MQIKINKAGLSSMVILILVVLGIAIAWEISIFTANYLEQGSANKPAGRQYMCLADPSQCDEGAGPLLEVENESCPSGNPQDCSDSGDRFTYEE